MSTSYLGITGHFFSLRDHHRHRVTLAVRTLHFPHTAVNISRLVQEDLTEWAIPTCKVSAILTDNGSNIVAAFRHCCDESEDEKDIEDYVDSDGEDLADINGDVVEFKTNEINHEVVFSPIFKD